MELSGPLLEDSAAAECFFLTMRIIFLPIAVCLLLTTIDALTSHASDPSLRSITGDARGPEDGSTRVFGEFLCAADNPRSDGQPDGQLFAGSRAAVDSLHGCAAVDCESAGDR